jgi:signal peptidase I
LSKKTKSELGGWIRAFVMVLLLAFVVRHYLFTNYIVHGESMMPSLQNGNRLFVNKVGYDFREPHYGDIVIFHATPTDDFIKRVIGLPGDTIEYKNDHLYRNGKFVPEPYLTPYKDNLPLGKRLTDNFTLKEKTGQVKVPPGKLWVMGDNRQISYDSREIGFVDMKKLVGKVSLRYYPFSEINFLRLKQ